MIAARMKYQVTSDKTSSPASCYLFLVPCYLLTEVTP